MIKRYFAFGLTVMLSLSMTALAQSTLETEKIRAKVQTLAVNRDSRVEVKLQDNTRYKGFITEVEAGTFGLSDSKTGTIHHFSYSEVAEIKKAGGGISTKTWLILGGVAAGTVTTWLIVKPAVCDGGAQTRGIC